MAKSIAINGKKLNEVRMLMEPTGNDSIAYLSYPMSQIGCSRGDDELCLVTPAYLAVELYRSGVLPQDENTPVAISVGGRPVGRYTVSDVRYPDRCSSPFGQVTFTFARVRREPVRSATVAPARSDSAVAGRGTYVTDITHYLDATGELATMPAPARQLASFLVLLIESATSASMALDHDSGIRCRTEACQGTIRTSLATNHDEIIWHCPVCGHNGVIRNWRDTKWNQSNATG